MPVGSSDELRQRIAQLQSTAAECRSIAKEEPDLRSLVATLARLAAVLATECAVLWQHVNLFATVASLAPPAGKRRKSVPLAKVLPKEIGRPTTTSSEENAAALRYVEQRIRLMTAAAGKRVTTKAALEAIERKIGDSSQAQQRRDVAKFQKLISRYRKQQGKLLRTKQSQKARRK